jgi:hypothetical protein
MENRTEIKEAVKAEVIKLMAQELKQEDSFKTLQKELAAELFNLEEPQKAEPEVEVEPAKPTRPLRALNVNWGYDPVNKKEEKVKKLLGFLYNPKDLKGGFIGQEITEAEEKFMANSSFTKQALIDELQEKITELKKGIDDSQYEPEAFGKVVKKLTPPEAEPVVEKTASEKLEEFKNSFYGKTEINADTIREKIANSLRTNTDFAKNYNELILKDEVKKEVVASVVTESKSEVKDTIEAIIPETPSKVRKPRVKASKPKVKKVKSAKVTAAGKKAKK